MRHKLRIFIINSQLVLLSFISHAQETVPAAGGLASGSSGKASYTVGQIFYKKNSDSNGAIIHGVQQPYEIFEIKIVNQSNALKFETDLKQANEEIRLEYSVCPNPTNGLLILRLGENKPENLSYQIFSINGEIIINGVISEHETSISMGNIISGVYFLKIHINQKEVKTFKIIKE